MSTAQIIVQERQAALFNQTGTFFAFSQQQFDAKKVQGVEYTFLAGGFVVPVQNVQKLVSELKTIHDEGREQELAENGIDKIILRELNNYEAFYLYEWEETFEALKDSGFDVTAEQVRKVFNDNKHFADY